MKHWKRDAATHTKGAADLKVNLWNAQAFTWDTSLGPFSLPSCAGGCSYLLPAEAAPGPDPTIHDFLPFLGKNGNK